MGKSRKVTYELRATSTRNSQHTQACTQDKEAFLSWAVKGLSVFCAICPNVNLLEVATFWAHPSRAPVVCQNCSTGQASGKSANALLRSIFNEIRYSLDRGEVTLARALILSEACFTSYFLNSPYELVKFLESFNSWPDLDDEDIDKLRSSNALKNVFAGTNTCTSLSQNVEAVKSRVGMVRYLLLPPWLLQNNTERLHRSLKIVEITFLSKQGGTNENHTVRLRSGHTFKTLVILLAHEAKTESQFVRITHNNGRPLFSSACSNRKIEDLCIKDGTVMTYFNAQCLQSATAAAQDVKPESTNSSRRKSSKVKKLPQQTQKKRSSSGYQPTYNPSSIEMAKERHSQLLTQLFEEAHPKFSEIRKTLNDLAIQKSKNKSHTRKTSTSHKAQSNPTNVGGSAPGQVMHPILVGNIEDLYKSSKRSSGSGRKHPQTKRRLSIDLHGYTTDEALKALNESLPRWIDSAMRGSHPFVEVVDIITGGGKQILSEAVELWIKSNSHVARRPKSFCRT